MSEASPSQPDATGLVVLSPVPPDAVALALDIGGTKLAAGIVTGAGKLVVSRFAPTADAKDDEELFAQLCGLAVGVTEEWLPQASPIVIGVGCDGPMRDNNRLVSPLNIPVWRDFSLRERRASSSLCQLPLRTMPRYLLKAKAGWVPRGEWRKWGFKS